MAPCSNHASRKKGSCHSCGSCKLCPPLTDGSCKTPDDHIHPGRKGRKRRQTPRPTTSVAAKPSRESIKANINYRIESSDDEKDTASLKRRKTSLKSSEGSPLDPDKVPYAGNQHHQNAALSSTPGGTPKHQLVDICTTLGLSETLRLDLESMAESGFKPETIAANRTSGSRTHRRAKRIRTCIIDAVDELLCPQEPQACATQLVKRAPVKDSGEKAAPVETSVAKPNDDMTSSSFATYPVQCHCGRVKATVQCSSTNIVAWDCNCSDCNQRKNIHFIVPANQLERSDEMTETLQDATILYQWGTKTAQRRFCKTCGILPFYTPRSNASDRGYGVTLACVDFGNNGPQVEIRKYDGVNWEKSFKETNIANESK